jgi:hypothetical protein
MCQKAGVIQSYRTYEKGEEKWLKEHIPRKGQGGISEEGQEILEDGDIWTNETTLHGVIHESRKRERSNDDGVFIQHQKGPITSTFTTDWFLWEGETRVAGRMDEVDLGSVSRPEENVTSELSYVPVQRLDSPDYDEKGIRQIRLL